MTRVTWASRYDARNAAKGWSDQFLQCRIYGHNWHPYTAKYISRYKYWYVVQGCDCGSFRHQEMSTTGAVISSRIEYVEGYLTDQVGRLAGESKDMVRLVAMQRLYTDASSTTVKTEPKSKPPRLR